MSASPVAIFIRHAHSIVDFEKRSEDWVLSDQGRVAATRLGERLVPYKPKSIVASPERKARETAEVIAAILGLEVQLDADLREHEASAYLPEGDFYQAVRTLLEQPDKAVFGETGTSAAERFARALSQSRPTPAVFVSHGRIMSSYLSKITNADGWALWQELTMPDAIHVSVDTSGKRHVSKLFKE